jgi:hypothetical protein
VSGLSVLVSWKGVTERCSKRMSLVSEYQLIIFDSCAKMFGGVIVPKARNYALCSELILGLLQNKLDGFPI